MSLHLIKLSVGVESVQHLAEIQAHRLEEAYRNLGKARLWHVTRHGPRRAEELLDGGSIYWVIKRLIQVRQRLIGFEPATDGGGRPACRLLLDPDLVRVAPRPHKPFQGWRYLRGGDAPPDARTLPSADGLPPQMATELRSLGLL